MALNIGELIVTAKNVANIDSRFGPYENTSTALSKIPDGVKAVGLLVGIYSNDSKKIDIYTLSKNTKDLWVLEKNLDSASDTSLGGIKLGYTQNDKKYPVELGTEENNNKDKAFVEVPWENTTYNTATTTADGLMSSEDKNKLDSLENFNLEAATDSKLGGIKLGYTQNGKKYPVKLGTGNDLNKAFVEVPWENTTYNTATTSTNGLMSSEDKIKLNSLENFNLEAATSSELGGIKLGYTADGTNYPVELSTDSKAYVSVPSTIPLATENTLGGFYVSENDYNPKYPGYHPVKIDPTSKSAFVLVPLRTLDHNHGNLLHDGKVSTGAAGGALLRLDASKVLTADADLLIDLTKNVLNNNKYSLKCNIEGSTFSIAKENTYQVVKEAGKPGENRKQFENCVIIKGTNPNIMGHDGDDLADEGQRVDALRFNSDGYLELHFVNTTDSSKNAGWCELHTQTGKPTGQTGIIIISVSNKLKKNQ